MFSKVIDEFKNMESKTKHVMNYGINFSFIICISATLLLLINNICFSIYDLFLFSLLLFRFGLLIVASSICCAFAITYFKNNLKN